MEKLGFNLLDTDIIKEVANIGASNAATSLSKIVHKRISVNVPEVSMPEFKDLSKFLGGGDKIVSGLLVNVTGEISGMIMYIMTKESSCALIENIMHKKFDSFEQFGDIEVSALTEIGNILISSYLTAVAKLLNLNIKQSLPYHCIDMADAILSVPAAEFGKVGNNVLFIKSNFDENDALSGYFMLIPDVEKDKNIIV
jgi:chemotaxis protein CheC